MRSGTAIQFVARSHWGRGELDASAAAWAQAEAIAAQIRQVAPDDVYLLRSQAASSAKYACLVERQRGRFEAALQACERALETLKTAYGIAPEHQHRHHDGLGLGVRGEGRPWSRTP